MRKTLYLMCGPAGSGKTTYVSKRIIADNIRCCHHSSRDLIRFGLVKENEDYFSKEDEVFELFCKDIDETLHSDIYDCVYADATHLTAKARAKTLDKINLKNVDIIPIFLDTSHKETLRRNAERTGRRFVPETVVSKMHQSARVPTFGENKYDYKEIIVVTEYGETILKKEEA